MNIFVIDNHSCKPPDYGGAHRSYYLYSELSENSEIRRTVFEPFFQEFPNIRTKKETKEITETYTETILREGLPQALIRIFDNKILRRFRPRKSLLYYLNFLKNKKRLKENLEWADKFIVKQPYYYNSVVSEHPVIYDTENFEYGLAKEIDASEKYQEMVYRMEKKVCEEAERIVAASYEDKKGFIDAYNIAEEKITVIPHGVKKLDKLEEYEPSEREYGLFIGTNFKPNNEAAQKIIEAAENMPEEEIRIAGSVCDTIKETPENVVLEGFVSEERKIELYKNAKYGLNPVDSGAGMNIKVLEYFKYSLPVISTEKGARGGFEEYVEIMPSNQISSVAELSNGDLKELSNKARKGLGKYNWEKLSKQFQEKVL